MGVAGCPGIPGRIKSEWVAGCYRNQWPDRPGIRIRAKVSDPGNLKALKLPQQTVWKLGVQQDL